MDSSKILKRNFVFALLALMLALFAMAAATFAWYIYNTSAHTTNVHMAAGASVSLQISNKYDSGYGSAAVMDEFKGTLNPVSTDKISNGKGFQKVYGFTNRSENQPTLVASLFGDVEASDYYKTSLYIRTNSGKLNVYLSNIGYEDDDSNRPISTAIRIGIVPHTDKNQEYIFEINNAKNPEAEYNTQHGQDGNVLNSTKKDGTIVPFTPYNSDNFCIYNADEGTASLKEKSVALCTVEGKDGSYGEPVQIDIYIWLEGCDSDCTNNLCARTLKNLALSFAGFAEG